MDDWYVFADPLLLLRLAVAEAQAAVAGPDLVRFFSGSSQF